MNKSKINKLILGVTALTLVMGTVFNTTVSATTLNKEEQPTVFTCYGPELVVCPEEVAPELVVCPEEVAPELVVCPEEVAPELVVCPEEVVPEVVVCPEEEPRISTCYGYEDIKNEITKLAKEIGISNEIIQQMIETNDYDQLKKTLEDVSFIRDHS